jgi:pimeloyl-ACP methyl ester carboxylesterase
VGGHSYGAFMAANLLAHAPDLFAAGIARSGWAAAAPAGPALLPAAAAAASLAPPRVPCS